MELILYIMFLLLSLIIISIGLFKPEHTEMALLGFVFLFLLGLNLEAGSIEYKTGVNETYEFGCICCGEQGINYDCTENTSLTITKTIKTDVYNTFTLGGTLSHIIGYWLMIMSAVGLIGVFLGIRHSKGFR